ncbi:hypothetical protein F4679DRAFT_557349 [Xylaria curta]|nr:hypothetical protein F4679DRAFT_557349 [Xylaria curta]
MSTVPDEETDWRDIEGIEIEIAQARLATSSAATAIHPLAAPNGWRRFWGPAYWVYENDPNVYVGPFCKACFAAGESSLCEPQVEWEKRDDFHGRRACARTAANALYRKGIDLSVISYRAFPNEEKFVDKIGFYKTRRMISERVASVGTDNEIPTLALNFSPCIRISPPQTSKKGAPVSNPNYGLPTPPTASITRVPLSKGPVWVNDMHRHSPLPSALTSLRPHFQVLARQSLPLLPKSRQINTSPCLSRIYSQPVMDADGQSLWRASDNHAAGVDSTYDEGAPVFGHLWLSERVPCDDSTVARRASHTGLQSLQRTGDAIPASSQFSASIESDTLSTEETSITTSASSSSTASTLVGRIKEKDETSDNTS